LNNGFGNGFNNGFGYGLNNGAGVGYGLNNGFGGRGLNNGRRNRNSIIDANSVCGNNKCCYLNTDKADNTKAKYIYHYNLKPRCCATGLGRGRGLY